MAGDMNLSFKIKALVAGAKDVAGLKNELGRMKNQAREQIPDNTRELRKGMDRTRGLARSLARELRSTLGGLAAAAGISMGVGKFVGINREFGKLNASLVTVTGSAEAARQAFISIERFAARTPFSVSQLTEAFIKLNALGLEPSEEALESYGNTASAMGKDLMQFIEAVADAATNEFERLKEFGIKASQEGDRVRFTFKGVTTEVGRNAQEITDYLKGIGQTDFAGAMERQAKTLDGAFSNAGDAVDSLARTIGDSGVTQLVIDIANAFRESVSWVDQFIQRFRDAEKITSLDAVEAEIASVTGKMELFQERYERAIAKLNRAVSMQGPEAMTAPHRQAIVNLVEQYQAWEKRLESLKKRQIELAETKLPTTGIKPPKIEDDGSVTRLHNQINETIKRLKIQASVLGMNSVEAELYKLKLEGATSAQLEAARAALESVEAYKAMEAEQEKAKKTGEDAARAERDRTETLANSAETVLNAIDPMRQLRKEEERLLALREHGFLTMQEYTQAQEDLARRMEETTGGLTQMTQFSLQAARNIQTAFADFLFDPFKEGMEGMLTGFTTMLRRMAAEVAAQEVLKSLFKGLSTASGDSDIGRMFANIAANVQHEGGMAGSGPRRQVPAAAFLGAPRLHNGGGVLGLKPDEVPTILQRGEEVLTASDPRHAANSGQVSVNVNINALDSRSFLERAAEVRQELAIGVAQAMRGYNLGSP